MIVTVRSSDMWLLEGLWPFQGLRPLEGLCPFEGRLDSKSTNREEWKLNSISTMETSRQFSFDKNIKIEAGSKGNKL